MHRWTFPLLLVATAASCTHRGVLPRGQGLDAPLEIHGRTDRPVTIRMIDGHLVQASRVAATEDSLIWIATGDGEARGAESLQRVLEVRAVDRAKGAVVGLASGLGVGVGLGLLLSLKPSNSNCDQGCGATIGSALIGSLGGILGLVFGAAAGHVDTFTPTPPVVPAGPPPLLPEVSAAPGLPAGRVVPPQAT